MSVPNDPFREDRFRSENISDVMAYVLPADLGSRKHRRPREAQAIVVKRFHLACPLSVRSLTRIG